MEIVASLTDNSKTFFPCVIALGTFDGLHRGHMTVIEAARDYARKHELRLAVFTFSNHPYSYIRPDRVPVRLISHKEKLEMLERFGVDLLIEPPFDEYLAELSASEFLQVLSRFNYRCLVCGENFTYGYMGMGTTQSLQMAGMLGKFDVKVINLQQDQNNVISSTSIRTLVQHGNLFRAASMLGRPYSIMGVVAHGFERGRELGFPTANLQLDRSVVALPPSGVYAASAQTSAGIWDAVANLGRNPTFSDVKQELMEVHIIGFQGDLYGQELLVTFYRFLRQERRFADFNALRAQLREDVRDTRSFFAKFGRHLF